MFKRLACISVILVFALSIPAGAEEPLRIAVDGAYPPFNYIDTDGQLKGFDVDIARALCRVMKRDCKLVVQEWDGMIPGLLARKFDAIVSSMSITDERKKAVNFTGHYYQVPARFVAREGSGLEISKQGLQDKQVGVQRATTYANYLQGEYDGIVDIRYYDTVDNHNLDLVNGRLDAVLAQAILMSEWLKSDAGKKFEFVGEPVRDESYIGEGAGIAVRKRDTRLLEELDAALDAILKDGTHQKIARKYFDFDVYNYH